MATARAVKVLYNLHFSCSGSPCALSSFCRRPASGAFYPPLHPPCRRLGAGMFGDTQVICTASVEENVPGFLKGKGQGWVTAEYGMLPRSTGSRMKREAASGKSKAAHPGNPAADRPQPARGGGPEKLGERQIVIDCDVIQADGGTRTASICGAWLAFARRHRRFAGARRAERIATAGSCRRRVGGRVSGASRCWIWITRKIPPATPT